MLEADDVGARRLEFQAHAPALNRDVENPAAVLMRTELALLCRTRADKKEASHKDEGRGEGRSQPRDRVHRSVLPDCCGGGFGNCGRAAAILARRGRPPAKKARGPAALPKSRSARGAGSAML